MASYGFIKIILLVFSLEINTFNMIDYLELNSENCFGNDEIVELSRLIGKFFIPNTSGINTMAISHRPGDNGINITCLEHNHYKITFHTGFLRFIFDGLYVILSDNTIFPKIGESSCLIKLPSLRYNFPKGYNDFKFDLYETEKAKFNDERVALHKFLFDTALKTIVLHEFYHILNGHLHYIKAHKKENLSTLDLHTLEMDADACAILALINFFFTESNKIPKNLNSKEGVIESIVFIIYFLFYLLPGVDYDDITKIKNLSHPSHPFRFGFMGATLFTAYPEGHELYPIIDTAISKILEVFPMVIKNISGETKKHDGLLLFSGLEGKKYFDEVTNNWNSIRPKLEPFALTKLAPYTSDFKN
jgi:hypothetical protein